MAEPALMAIAKKAKDISDGKINDFALRWFLFYCQFARGKNFILIPQPYDVESGHQVFPFDLYFAGCNIGY